MSQEDGSEQPKNENSGNTLQRRKPARLWKVPGGAFTEGGVTYVPKWLAQNPAEAGINGGDLGLYVALGMKPDGWEIDLNDLAEAWHIKITDVVNSLRKLDRLGYIKIEGELV